MLKALKSVKEILPTDFADFTDKHTPNKHKDRTADESAVRSQECPWGNARRSVEQSLWNLGDFAVAACDKSDEGDKVDVFADERHAAISDCKLSTTRVE